MIRHYLIRMSGIVFAVALLSGALWSSLKPILKTNIPLNCAILAVMGIGVVYSFYLVLRLKKEMAWGEAYQLGRPRAWAECQPKLLSPLAQVLEQEGLHYQPSLIRLQLEAVWSTLEESRSLLRYSVGLLVFMGLLGTFWGLSGTIAGIAQMVQNLPVDMAASTQFFTQLKTGIESPLMGMGTAFGSSLFGLAGSLVVGILALQASHAENRFFQELEGWVIPLTESPTQFSSENTLPPALLQAMVGELTQNLVQLTKLVDRGHTKQTSIETQLKALVSNLAKLSDQMRVEQNLLMKLGEGQLELQEIQTRLRKAIEQNELGIDEITKQHLQNMDLSLQSIARELPQGQAELMSHLGQELRMMSHVISKPGVTSLKKAG
ncbi:MotA/TolQ/ExbB proton channel family protein [Candidatus Bealeia paramacronuclearis]|uniref:MotA/TolQ/ExbB proton channel family protein n=1 Tax=Candidatus Bealeia paramacronuclearis TaxID=1921001 RepID=A0ABZ2C1N9_9PROT|nr:MotA/TolQ/ExbB proton channel family protein [Candidatus Bealeia paramacronuclearis]